MTTLAYRDGVMAADSGGWIGDSAFDGARKVAKGKSGTLYAVTGSAPECCAFLEWVDRGEKGKHPKPRELPDDRSSLLVLVAPPKGGVEIISANGVEKYPNAKYFSIGAASPVAFGAMFAGASAQIAIEAAKMHGSGAAGDVQFVKRGR